MKKLQYYDQIEQRELLCLIKVLKAFVFSSTTSNETLKERTIKLNKKYIR